MPTLDNGWPEAEAWATNLLYRLAHRAEVYEQEPDPALRRNKAAAMVGEIVAALVEVPGATVNMVLPLKDLLIFSEDMDNGVRHPWSRPSAGGTSIESFAKTELRRWAVVVYLALRDAGLSATAAYRHTAQVFVTSGRDITWRGVQGWVRAYQNGIDRRLSGVRGTYLEHWASVTCPHGASITECPIGSDRKCAMVESLGLQFAIWVATLPHLRDRFEP